MGQVREPAGRRDLTIHDGVLYGADAAVAKWVARRVPIYRPAPDARALGVVRGNRLVAGVAYENFNGVHIEAVIAGDHGRWASRGVLGRIFSYPFIQLGCHAISVSVAASNLESLNLATKLGFRPEALIAFAAHDGGPLVVLKAFRNECRWIECHGEKGRIAAEGTRSLGDSLGRGADQQARYL